MATCALLMTACSPSGLMTPVSTTTSNEATASVGPQGVVASVRVAPSTFAELGFVVSAPVREILVAEGDLVTAGQTLIVLDTPDLEYRVEAAAFAVVSAEADEYIQSQGRRKWDGSKFLWLSGPPEQRQVAHARVLQAQAELEAAQAELSQASLLAPFEGTVVSTTVSPGEVVQPGQVVLVMGDLSRLDIETTDLSERDVTSVHLGQLAHIKLESFASELAGRVSAISPKAEYSADGDTIFKVTMQFDHPPPQLMWGMTGEAEIMIGR